MLFVHFEAASIMWLAHHIWLDTFAANQILANVNLL